MKDFAIQMVDNADHGNVLDLKIQPVKDAEGKITNGIVIGNTLEQNKAFILLGHPNDFKENPTLGVGIEDILLSTELLAYRHKIREQFAIDGLKITNLDLYSLEKIKIDAHYEES
ncbi:hypothetical protein PL373_19095 [Tenacibaculum maritimum]|nr:hypothetical protein [Tenacibaculum maritimum]MDB0603196.1 hypothetical protein [Tenacibaculum maritimum]MDB0610458.1 hypothetical protein [Tenacibaculum maritimum]